MTGRMFLQPSNVPLPRHAGVVLNLPNETVVFEDPADLATSIWMPRAWLNLAPNHGTLFSPLNGWKTVL